MVLYRLGQRLTLALVLLASPSLAGCPHTQDGLRVPAVTTDNPQAEADLRLAREAFDAGRVEEASALLSRFLEEHATDPLAPLARLDLGRLRLAAGQIPEARVLFAQVSRSPDPTVAELGRFYDGVALHLLGQHREALEALRPLVGRTVDPEETALLLHTIAAASETLGNRIEALEALDALVRAPVSEEDRAGARQRIIRSTEEATPEEIERAATVLPRDGTAWSYAAQRALREAYQRGDLSRVQALSGELREHGVELDAEVQAMALRAERSAEADPRVIGALLPLSGGGREAGQHAMKGLMLAAGTPARGPMPPSAPQVIFRNTGGDPERAVRAVDELVSLHRAIALIGPLAGNAATRAAMRAQELGVPLIAVSPADDITEIGPMVFRLFLTPASETSELVRAARARGAGRFAVLYPDNPFGQKMHTAFIESVRAHGGQLAGSISYETGATSFTPQIERLSSLRFDALFVPDVSRQLALIAPALATGGLWSALRPDTSSDRRAFVLLVPSVGFDAHLARTTSRYLQGALFSMPFYAPTATGAGRTFADEFFQRFGVAADAYAAFAHDAFQLVRVAVEAGATDRAELAAALQTARAAVAGPSPGFGPGREPLHATRLVQLRMQRFVAADSTP